jgi:DNA repair protein RadA/Sms
MAVLEKIVGMQLSNYDAYVNVVGGLKLTEPACDLGVIMAIASSFKSIPVGHNTIFLGEIGLTGEVRAVSQIDKRVMEAARIGFKRCLVPSGNIKSIKQLKSVDTIEIKAVSDISEALDIIF